MSCRAVARCAPNRYALLTDGGSRPLGLGISRHRSLRAPDGRRQQAPVAGHRPPQIATRFRRTASAGAWAGHRPPQALGASLSRGSSPSGAGRGPQKPSIDTRGQHPTLRRGAETLDDARSDANPGLGEGALQSATKMPQLPLYAPLDRAARGTSPGLTSAEPMHRLPLLHFAPPGHEQGPDADRGERRKVSALPSQPRTDCCRVREERPAHWAARDPPRTSGGRGRRRAHAVDGGLCPTPGACGRRPTGARSDRWRPMPSPRGAQPPSDGSA